MAEGHATVSFASAVSLVLLIPACGGKPPPPPPPCDDQCRDGIALRALRETMRVAYNGTLMGRDVGPQDGTFQCLMGGTAHVSGTATSNAAQGSTFVNLDYDFHACLHIAVPNATPERNYAIVLDGSASEFGTIAVQPAATTSLRIQSPARQGLPTQGLPMTFAGEVNDPPVKYVSNVVPDAGVPEGCVVDVQQDGNTVSGFLCNRMAGFGF